MDRKEIKAGVTKVFKRARKELGVKARQNFSCCSTCATSEMGQRDDVSDGTPVLFYHRQDNEFFQKGRLNYGRSKLSLRFGHWEGTTEQDDELGRKLAAILDEEGIAYEWNGSSSKCIQVLGQEAINNDV